MVTVVVDGVVTGSYRYTTLKDVTNISAAGAPIAPTGDGLAGYVL